MFDQKGHVPVTCTSVSCATICCLLLCMHMSAHVIKTLNSNQEYIGVLIIILSTLLYFMVAVYILYLCHFNIVQNRLVY